MSASKPPPQRIAKLLARAGVASRREIERMIAGGRVAVAGAVIDTPATVLASLRGVTVDGAPVEAAAPARLFLYHKPPGLLVTERDPRGRPTIYDRLPADLPRVLPVGRLDLATEGLLLLTTDGELKRRLELPATRVERAYRARAYGAVTQARLEELIEGVEVDGVRYGPIDANLERRTGANVWIELILTEGKNREVRRVLEYLGLQVSRLIRTRYGPFVLGDLPPGGFGEVRQRDVERFRKYPTRVDLLQAARKDRSPLPAGEGSGVGQRRRGLDAPGDAIPGRARSSPRSPPAPDPSLAGRGEKRAKPTRAARPRVRSDGTLAIAANPARAARARARRNATGHETAFLAAPRPKPSRGPANGRGKPRHDKPRQPRPRK